MAYLARKAGKSASKVCSGSLIRIISKTFLMLFAKLRRKGICALFAGFVAVSSGFGEDGPKIEETVSVLQEWVKVEKSIAEERADWAADKDSLEKTIVLLKQEIKDLEAEIASSRDDVSAAEARRAELTQRNELLQGIEGDVASFLSKLEDSFKAVFARLPEPLQQELQPAYSALPEDSADTKLSIAQRIQPVVAMLTMIQKYNNAVDLASGFREFENGETVQTDVIYFGLGVAYYVDGANQHAGYAVLGDDGWTWKDDPAIAPTVRLLVDIYRGNKQAAYVDLPIEVK